MEIDVKRLKIGDSITVRNDSECDYVITEMPGCSATFPSDYRALDKNDGEHGLVSPDQITHVNGAKVSPQPTTNWHERGELPEWNGEPLLPPVGAVVLSDTTGHKGVKFLVTGYHAHKDLKGSECVHRVFVDLAYFDNPELKNSRMLRDIRPIPTQQDIEREELSKLVREAYLKGASDHVGGLTAIVDALQAANYRKDPKP